MPLLHPTASIDPHAELADDVTVGPFAVIGPHVRIGAGTTIGPHAVLDGWTTIGARCRIFAGAIVGTLSQDLKYKGQKAALVIEDDNVIREYVTISCGTDERSATRIGRGNLIMAYGHVAHDCVIGHQCVIANGGTLGGHVTVEDQVVIGGLAAIHQFVRVGRLAIIGGCSKVVQDVVPFSICDGHPARFRGANVVGLRRAGFSPAARRQVQQAFRLVFGRGVTTTHALAQLRPLAAESSDVRQLVEFVRGSKRGFCRAESPHRVHAASEPDGDRVPAGRTPSGRRRLTATTRR